MFSGGRTVIYSRNAEADRQFFSNVLRLRSVDAGGGWLIFSLPPSEIAFHPHDGSNAHEFYFMFDDIEAVRNELLSRGVQCSEPVDEGWGILASFTLPGGGSIGFYQPRHERP